jgi:hypothetical protein
MSRPTLKPDPDSYVVITKIDAAHRQLETATLLWFQEGDPVSIHTLVSAAMGILVPLAEKNGTWKGTHDTSFVRPDKKDEYLAWMKVHQNFFKHGSKDLQDSIKFNPEANLPEIRAAIEVYRQLKPDAVTPLMMSFCLWVFIRVPEVHNPAPYALISSATRASLLALPKKEFLTQALRLNKSPKQRS